MAIGTTNRLHHLSREEPKELEMANSQSANHNSSSLASFVLHVMCHNFVNPERQRRVAAEVVTSESPIATEMEDIVKVIEEWERSGNTRSVFEVCGQRGRVPL